MKLTIIIPVYNVKTTLERCVESVVAQQLPSVEVLLIDDGSTDGSALLADQLAEKHPEISVIHTHNGGLSAARNVGMAHATGQYVTFIDSDDALSPATLAPLMSFLATHSEIDMLEYPIIQNYESANEVAHTLADHIYTDALDWLSSTRGGRCWVCNKLFSRSSLAGVRFEEGRRYEDIYFMSRYLLARPTIATTSRGAYRYYLNPHGLTAQEQAKGLQSLLEAQMTLVERLHLDTREPRWQPLYLNMLTSQLHAYAATHELSLWRQHVSLAACRHKSDYVKAITANIFGLRTACWLFNKMRKR